MMNNYSNTGQQAQFYTKILKNLIIKYRLTLLKYDFKIQTVFKILNYVTSVS